MRVAILSILAVLAALVLWSMRGSGRGGGEVVGPIQEPLTERLDDEAGSLLVDRTSERTVRDDDPRGAESPAAANEAANEAATGELEGVEWVSADQAVRITLLDSGTQAPVAGHRFHLVPRFGGRGAQETYETNASGAADLRIASGEYALLCWGPDEGPDARSEVRTEPTGIEIPTLPDGVFHQTVYVRRPEATMRVRVVDEAGDPVDDASVYFGFRSQDVIESSFERTDAKGLAFLGVWESRDFGDGRLRAWDMEGNVSAYVPVQAPFVPGERVLVLHPAGSVHVGVRQRGAEPVTERKVALVSVLATGASGTLETDGEGRAEFHGVFPGSYLVRVWRDASSLYPDTRIEVRHGEITEVPITLDERQAVAGRVIDENGRGLGDVSLVVTPVGGGNVEVETLSDGSFACETDPCAELLVRANLSSEGDRFEPESVRVPFGTRDVLFRRVEAARRASFEVEVVDAETGIEVEHFSATIDRGPGTEEWGNSYAPRRRFELSVLPETRWRIASKGYLVAIVPLAEQLAGLEEGQRLRIELMRGLDAVVRVLDADTEQPLEGVRLRSESGGEAVTGSDGRVRVKADEWSLYRMSKPGYEPADWDPDEHVVWNFGPLYLSPSAPR